MNQLGMELLLRMLKESNMEDCHGQGSNNGANMKKSVQEKLLPGN